MQSLLRCVLPDLGFERLTETVHDRLKLIEVDPPFHALGIPVGEPEKVPSGIDLVKIQDAVGDPIRHFRIVFSFYGARQHLQIMRLVIFVL